MQKNLNVRLQDILNIDLLADVEVLFTQFNTIIYRINRIMDVFKIDLKDPETAITMQLAIRIRDLLL